MVNRRRLVEATCFTARLFWTGSHIKYHLRDLVGVLLRIISRFTITYGYIVVIVAYTWFIPIISILLPCTSIHLFRKMLQKFEKIVLQNEWTTIRPTKKFKTTKNRHKSYISFCELNTTPYSLVVKGLKLILINFFINT